LCGDALQFVSIRHTDPSSYSLSLTATHASSATRRHRQHMPEFFFCITRYSSAVSVFFFVDWTTNVRFVQTIHTLTNEPTFTSFPSACNSRSLLKPFGTEPIFESIFFNNESTDCFFVLVDSILLRQRSSTPIVPSIGTKPTFHRQSIAIDQPLWFSVTRYHGRCSGDNF